MVVRLTPDQKVACSNHVGVTILFFFFFPLSYFRLLLTKLSFAGYHLSAFQICPVRNIPAAKALAFSRFVLFVGWCSKYYMVAERPGNTYYEDDVSYRNFSWEGEM